MCPTAGSDVLTRSPTEGSSFLYLIDYSNARSKTANIFTVCVTKCSIISFHKLLAGSAKTPWQNQYGKRKPLNQQHAQLKHEKTILLCFIQCSIYEMIMQGFIQCNICDMIMNDNALQLQCIFIMLLDSVIDAEESRNHGII